MGERWLHVSSVGERAQAVAAALPVHERSVLISAAYLHDIGYAPCLRRTGSHQIDGACYIGSIGHPRLASLIAHHSSARFEVQLRGLSKELVVFKDECSVLSDALTYCDFTTGPTGQEFTVEERFAEIATRYHDDELIQNALKQARPHITEAVTRFGLVLEGQALTDVRLRASLQVVLNPQTHRRMDF